MAVYPRHETRVPRSPALPAGFAPLAANLARAAERRVVRPRAQKLGIAFMTALLVANGRHGLAFAEPRDATTEVSLREWEYPVVARKARMANVDSTCCIDDSAGAAKVSCSGPNPILEFSSTRMIGRLLAESKAFLPMNECLAVQYCLLEPETGEDFSQLGEVAPLAPWAVFLDGRLLRVVAYPMYLPSHVIVDPMNELRQEIEFRPDGVRISYPADGQIPF